MKIRLPFIALLAALALLVAACGSDDAEETTTTTAATTTTEADEPTVLQLAVEAGQFSTLIAAIEAAGLEDALSGEGPLTVFAPTDQAFEQAFDALGITPEELLADTETLTAILTYHVLPQEANSQLVATLDGQSVPTLNGQSVAISVDGAMAMSRPGCDGSRATSIAESRIVAAVIVAVAAGQKRALAEPAAPAPLLDGPTQDGSAIWEARSAARPARNMSSSRLTRGGLGASCESFRCNAAS